MATFFLLLDAFRHDYLCEETTPFLAKCAREGEHYQKVVPGLGFCERAEILSGLPSSETGFFTAIGFDPEHSSYREARALPWLHRLERMALPLISATGDYLAPRIHGRLRGYVNRYYRSRGAHMATFMIPFHLMKYFALTEDLVDHREPGVFGRPSILDRLRDAGRPYDYDSFTAVSGNFPYRSDEERLAAVPPKVGNGDADLFLIYVGLPDASGHHYGPGTEGMKKSLHGLDQRLAAFVRDVKARPGSHRFIFLGDHGMVPVEQQVDAESELLRCLGARGLRLDRDFVYFLDSTMVRVWALRPEAEDAVSEAILASELLRRHGRFLDAELAARFHVPWQDRRYGDHLWLANAGVLIFPDFFHRTHAEVAMHGYDPTLPECQGMCIHWGEGVQARSEASIPLTGVYDVLAQSLEL